MIRLMLKKAIISGLAALMIPCVFATYMYGGDRDFIYVDDDADPGWYDGAHVMTVQEGVDAAAPGDTVFVYNGTYYEHVVVDIMIDLIGEDRILTIIDGSGWGDVVTITADQVLLENFTIQNGLYGVWAETSSNINITRNIIRDHIAAPPSEQSPGSQTSPYLGSLSNGCGIVLVNTLAVVTENIVMGNSAGISVLGGHSSLDRIYHNNFLDNIGLQAYSAVWSGALWDNGYPSGGNYWSDHEGYDPDRDGISNFRYVIPACSWNVDHYPLMNPFGWKINAPGHILEEYE